MKCPGPHCTNSVRGEDSGSVNYSRRDTIADGIQRIEKGLFCSDRCLFQWLIAKSEASPEAHVGSLG